LVDGGQVLEIGGQNKLLNPIVEVIPLRNGIIIVIDSFNPIADVEPPTVADIIDTRAAVDGEWMLVSQALGMFNIKDQLKSNMAAFTVFAPSDQAIGPLMPQLTTMDPAQVQQLLGLHVVAGAQPVTSDLFTNDLVLED